MTDTELVERLRQGSDVWNAWRERQSADVLINLMGADLYDADLHEANLSSADLRDANLNSANLVRINMNGANLSKADLSRASLISANLSRASLNGAHLIRANLDDADLSGSNLSSTALVGANLSSANLSSTTLVDADLSDANLSYANLIGANLIGAYLWETVFANLDLRQTKGLLELVHKGPSHVELPTIKLPQDGSALHFLRGAGIPNEWIDFYRTTMMHPIQYHSCFISYSGKDLILARRLHADLQDQGVRCWFAPEDMKIGDKIRARIDEAIHLQDKLLLLLSEHSLASAWVEDEVEAALEKEQRQQREVLFPVRLDESVMQTNAAWAAKLRRMRYIGDFTNWTEPQAYQQAFERLLRDLKTERKTSEGK